MSRPVWLVAGLALAASLASCKRAAPPSGGGSAPVPIRAAKAERRTMPVTYDAVGIAQSLRSVAIQSQVDGVIESVHFRDGDTVETNALLVTLDKRPFVARLKLAEAGFRQAKVEAERATSELARYEKLVAGGLVSQETYLQYATAEATAQAAVAARQAELDTARLDLGYTEIRAPFTGRTSRLALREGSLVKANDATRPLLTINQLAPLAVEFSVTENILDSVRSALAAGTVPVEGRLQDGSGRTVRGHLDYFDNTVDATTGTIGLRAVFDNEDHALWPGVFVRVTVILGEIRDATVVPAAAVTDGQNGSLAFVVKEDNGIDIRTVLTGRRDTDLVVVTRGIAPGETVVTDGQIRLTPRSRVVIRNDAPAPGDPDGDAPDPAPGGSSPPASASAREDAGSTTTIVTPVPGAAGDNR
ncbi:RND transporter [Opitutaceae bacterium TAV5]|nr:RND transporter [Opitutaceae bacterium TAV5]